MGVHSEEYKTDLTYRLGLHHGLEILHIPACPIKHTRNWQTPDILFHLSFAVEMVDTRQFPSAHLRDTW